MTSVKDFQIINKLGEGAYSSVYKVKRLSDNQEYALKKVKLQNLSDKEKQNALNEVRILASIKHPNLIAYKEAFLEDNANSLCIVMEYANNGDLFQKIVEHQKKGTFFSEAEIWNYFIQMVKALKALHDLKIFHRDLKSANIFLNKDGSIKLGDLNVSKVAKKGLLYTQTGTPYYASPEVWRDMPYDSKADVWSLGCVIYEITTLKPPFRAEDMEGLYKKVLRGYYPRIQSNYSQDLSNVIRALLQVSPSLRPSCDKLLQLPSVIKRLEERHLIEFEESVQNVLLSTIRIPKNIMFLAERLPKADYTPYKTRKVEKHKFMQTLAGHKNHSENQMLEEMVRGSESVDSFKKDNNGRIYLPSVNREAQNKGIKKIYGSVDRPKKEIVKTNITRISGGAEDSYDYESDVLSVRKNTDVKLKKKVLDHDKEGERDRSLKNESYGHQPKQSEGHGKVAYKVHNLDQDVIFDKYNHLKNVYGVKQSNRSIDESSVLNKPKPLGIKAHKYNAQSRSPSDALAEYGVKKSEKLPPLGHDKSEKNLPPLVNAAKAYGGSNISPKKGKPKELSKVYKVNIGEFDDLAEKYSNVLNKPVQRGRPVNAKRYEALDTLEHDIKVGKYKKGYENALF